MIIDSMNMEGLGENTEKDFLLFESRLRESLQKAEQEDYQRYSDRNGEYIGSFLPQKHYVSSILAFLDEYGLELDVSDITNVGNSMFLDKFTKFFTDINYARTKLLLKIHRNGVCQTATPIMIESNFKEEIHAILGTIRKIVNQNVQNQSKKEAIFGKIESLQSEIDRDRTTLDALFDKFLELTRVLGDGAENLEPAVKKIERIMAAFGSGIRRLKNLIDQDQPKRLPPLEVKNETLKDDCPF